MNKEIGEKLVEKLMRAASVGTGEFLTVVDRDTPGFELLRGMRMVHWVPTVASAYGGEVYHAYSITEVGLAFLRSIGKLKTQAGTT